MAKQTETRKRYWVWVTSKYYYQDENGNDCVDLDPKSDPAIRNDNWWTCHRDTKAGDLILLYRSRPKSDLAYMLEARSAAKIWRISPPGTPTPDQYERWVADFLAAPKNKAFAQRFLDIETRANEAGISIEALGSWTNGDIPRRHRALWKEYSELMAETNMALGLGPEPELAGEWEGSWVCDYAPRFKLSSPLTREQMKTDPRLVEHWGALRGNFQQRAYEIPELVWSYLVELVGAENSGFQTMVNGLMTAKASHDILTEKALEDDLAANLDVLAPDFKLRLYQGNGDVTGRQYACSWGGGQMGFMDLLCIDQRNDGYLVIELKIVRAGLAAFSQLRSYIGWVKEHLAREKPVRGLLICDGLDNKFQYAARASEDILVLGLSDVRERLKHKRQRR